MPSKFAFPGRFTALLSAPRQQTVVYNGNFYLLPSYFHIFYSWGSNFQTTAPKLCMDSQMR